MGKVTRGKVGELNEGAGVILNLTLPETRKILPGKPQLSKTIPLNGTSSIL